MQGDVKVLPKQDVRAASPTASRLRGLDALRGLAALSVVLFHYTIGYITYLGPYKEQPLFYASHGHFGVELFFCISGFVILGTIERTGNLRRFAIARFARIYPAYFVCALISLATAYSSDFQFLKLTGRAIAINSTMLTELIGARPIDPSYWTLSYEVIFYFGAGIVWSLLGSRKRFEVPCLVWLACSLALHFIPSIGDHKRLRVLINLDYAHLFVAGMMLYYLTQGSRTRLTLPTLCASLMLTSFPPEYNGGHLSQNHYVMMILAFWGLIWIAAKTGGRFLDLRPLVFLGDISYSLYLIHQDVGFALIRAFLRAGIETNLAIVLTICIVICLAFGLRVLVEKPAERLIKSLALRKTSNRQKSWQAVTYGSVRT